MFNQKYTIIVIASCMLIVFFTACGSSINSANQSTEPSNTITQTSSSSNDSMREEQTEEDTFFSEDEKDQIANAVFEEIKKMDNGDSTTTTKLMIKKGYDVYSYPPLEVVDIHSRVVELAPKNNIILDQSKYDGMVVGLPQNLEFIVRK